MSRIVYLECREENHNKFYLMTEDPTGTTFVARWGRIGTEGSFCMYSISYWHKKLHERLSHGYVDRTQDYLDGKIKDSAVWTGVGEAKYKMSGTRKNWLGHVRRMHLKELGMQTSMLVNLLGWMLIVRYTRSGWWETA